MTTTYLGLDPGASGGLGMVIVGSTTVTTAILWPSTEREIADLIQEMLDGEGKVYACIEAVHSMPKQGVASSFKFGQHYGFLRGLLIAYAIPFIEVSPQKWQKAMGCQTGGDKNVSKRRAQQLVPGQRITHAIADALLLAVYCSRQDWRGVA